MPYNLPADWNIVGTGDFNSDGQTDLVLQHDDGSVAFWLLEGTTINLGVVSYTPPKGWRVVGPK
ncbi:MAG: hypothetical protein HY043_18585 [Verrucomicrobia bacterium]|nr:hypothetical protein [Verrucomicrobiota bacterium]